MQVIRWPFILLEVKIQYEFVGTAFCQYDPLNDAWDYADVYVFNLTQPGKPTEALPFIYKGGRQVVVDRPQIQVIIDQRNSEQNTPADG